MGASGVAYLKGRGRYFKGVHYGKQRLQKVRFRLDAREIHVETEIELPLPLLIGKESRIDQHVVAGDHARGAIACSEIQPIGQEIRFDKRFEISRQPIRLPVVILEDLFR